MFLKQLTDDNLSQHAYLIGCEESGEAILVDPQRDIDRYLAIAAENDLDVVAVTETHIHADFLAGTREYLAARHDGIAYLSGLGGKDWQYEWARGDQRVRLLAHGDRFSIGKIQITALHTPGHTPEHLSFLFQAGDEPHGLLSGDFLFVGDVGRPDLLDSAARESDTRGPAAEALFESIEQFDKLPDYVLVLPGHGAGSSCGKSLGSVPFSSAGFERRTNEALVTAGGKGKEAFLEYILEGQPEPPRYFSRMKDLNRSGPPVVGDLTIPRQLNGEDVSRLLSGETGRVTFLDTRSDRDEFMKRHLAGSLFTPAGPKFSEATGSYAEPDSEIVLIVSSSEEVEAHLRQLVRIGFDHVAGWVRWDDILHSTACQSWLRSTEMIDVVDLDPESRVLDVRSADEFESGHVPDAYHLAHTRLVADAEKLPKPGPITVHCGSGMRASLAVAALERMGFDVTFANGLFADWKEQADSVATAEAA